MRVGLVCPYDMGSPGGVQQLVAELAGQLQSAGDEVVVVTAGNTGLRYGPKPDDETVPTGRVYRLRGNRSEVPVTLDPGVWKKVGSVLKDVEVINVHEPLVPLVGWAALARDKSLVATFHADAPGWARSLYRWAPVVAGRMKTARLTAVSRTAAQAIPPRWGEIEVIPNAIDVASYELPVVRVPGRVAFLGRDDPRKGLDVLLEAWPLVRESRPEAELVVMGADRGIPPPGVIYLGPVSGEEKKRTLASSSVFVAPNTGSESFGMVVAEGMAAGCAVVASDLDSFRDVLGGTGWIVDAGDSDALSAAMMELLDSPEEARRLGSAARERSRRYDWSVVTGRYREIYSEALR